MIYSTWDVICDILTALVSICLLLRDLNPLLCIVSLFTILICVFKEVSSPFIPCITFLTKYVSCGCLNFCIVNVFKMKLEGRNFFALLNFKCVVIGTHLYRTIDTKGKTPAKSVIWYNFNLHKGVRLCVSLLFGFI